MMESFRRWIAGESDDDGAGGALVRWGRGQGWKVARVDEGSTSVAEGVRGASTVRVEWGAAQRNYLGETELRVRCMLDVPASLQLLVLSTRVAEQLELQAYQRLTEDARTELDVTVPEEMRWLTMLPRVNLGQLPSTLRSVVVVIASHTSVGAQWLDAALAAAIAAAPDGSMEGPARLAMMLHRGRLTLRVGVRRLDNAVLEWASSVHEMAATNAVNASVRMMDNAGWATTASATWQTQLMGPESLDVES